MRNITEEARLVMNTRRNFVNYAHVTLHNGDELFLKPSDFRISGNSFTDDWNDGEAFQLGSAIGKTATLLLDNTDGRTEEIEGETVVYPHGKFSEYDFYMAYFELYIHLPDATHYQGELIDEIISIGTFTVTTPASHGATIEITGVDNMHMFDKPFNDCTLNFSGGQTLYTILRRCCTDCGVAIGFSSFLNQGITVYKKPKDVTYREVVSYIAQLAGCNAVISVTGALTLKYYDMTPLNEILDGGRFNPWDGVDNVRDTLDGGSFNPWTEGDIVSGGNFTDILPYHNLTATNGTSVSTDDIHFTGIMVSYEIVNSEGSTEKLALHYPNVSDWDTYAMHIDDNPFVETQAIANTIATSVWDVISPLTFRVFSCSSIQDPTIEAGDCALVYDVKGNVYPTIVTNVKFTTGGMTDVSCTAESPVKQNSRYVNPAAKAEAKAIQKQDDYNAMVAHFNELANGSLGYYKTQTVEEGATVTYIHDNPELASSRIIWKITAAGYFVSEDGGQSWNTGYDASTGTMLMNLIYVNGLHAKWITAGSIDADRLKANVITSINNSTGTTTISGGKINIAGVVSGINAGSTTINGGKITTNTITASQIAANAITSSELSANAVTADKINANAVTAGKIAASAVTADKINANAVTTDKINAGAVTSGKISVNNLAAISANMGTVNVGGNGNGNGVLKVNDASGSTKVTLNNEGIKATYGEIGGWTIQEDGLTYGDDARVRPNRIACGSHGATLIGMSGKSSSGDHSGYIEVCINENSDYIHIHYDYISRSDGTYAYFREGSDRRLKKNIKELSVEEARLIIDNSKPVSFRYKKHDEIKQYGFIAQDIDAQCEKLGLENPFVKNGERGDGMKVVDYEQYITPLIKVVQDQQNQIDLLKQEIESLKQLVNTK